MQQRHGRDDPEASADCAVHPIDSGCQAESGEADDRTDNDLSLGEELSGPDTSNQIRAYDQRRPAVELTHDLARTTKSLQTSHRRIRGDHVLDRSAVAVLADRKDGLPGGLEHLRLLDAIVHKPGV